jgi:hypothetical protein
MVNPPGPVPRRWNVEVDGIRWLPRMSDKARMSANGTLGAYLIGHSPVDRSLLQRLGLTTAEFVRIVAASPDDAALLAALRARGMDEAAIRLWSDEFERRFGALIPLWDLDEGYKQPSALQKPLLALLRRVEHPLMAAYRRLTTQP